jgi:hypothetical protein
MDSMFPVWHPYYVSWAITLLCDIILLVAPCVFRKPVDAFDIISISVQSLRICNLLVLTWLYLVLRIRQGVYDDGERQSLLKGNLAPKPSSSHESSRSTNYRATAGSSSEARRQADEEENEYYKNRREDEERLVKRWKNDGNGWAYVKGFAVSIYYWSLQCSFLLYRSLFPTYGQCIARFSNSELYLLDYA